jgi:hypothetical protein
VTVAAVPIDLWATTSQKGDGNQIFSVAVFFFFLFLFPKRLFFFLYFILFLSLNVMRGICPAEKKFLWAKCP